MPTIPARLPWGRNGPTKSSGPRLLTAGQGGALYSLSKGRMLVLLQPIWVQEDIKGRLNRPQDPGFEFNKCGGVLSFLLLVPTIHGSSDNYLIRPPIGPLYSNSLQSYFLQTPEVPGQIDITTMVEAGFRCGIPQLRSGRERFTC